MIARLHGGKSVAHGLAVDALVRRENSQPLDQVLQLAHVPGPGVLLERLDAGVGQLGLAIVARIVFADEEAGQQRHVAPPLA